MNQHYKIIYKLKLLVLYESKFNNTFNISADKTVNRNTTDQQNT